MNVDRLPGSPVSSWLSSRISHGSECVATHCQGLFGNYRSLRHVLRVSPPSDWSEWMLLIIGPQGHACQRKEARQALSCTEVPCSSFRWVLRWRMA